MLLPIHRRLLWFTALIVIASLAVHFAVIYPRQKANEAQRARKDALATDLKPLNVFRFQLDPDRLRGTQKILEKDRQVVRDRLRKVAEHASSTFRTRVESYGGVPAFRQGISILTFQEKFASLRSKLAEAGIRIDEEVLGMSPETAPQENTYRLVAHLWLVEDLAFLAKEHKLDLATGAAVSRDNPEGGEKETFIPARITALPFKLYGVGDPLDPVLEEYPVKLTLRGELPDFCRFLAALTRAGTFIPLEQCFIRKVGIEQIWEGKPKFDAIEATLICSAFLIIKESEFTQGSGSDSKPSEINIPPWHRGT